MGRKIINRKAQSLGNPAHSRSVSQIKYFVWHYTATNTSFITNHERYWRDTLGWRNGGYHFYIDRQGNIYQNYDLTQVTNGVANSNSFTAHVSVEAVSKHDYTQAQIEARDWLTRYLLQGPLKHLNGNSVRGHWEVYNNSSCPGYNRTEMNNFRSQLMSGAKVSSPVSSGSTGTASGAKLLKNEDGDFKVLAKDGIKVRNAPSAKATHTGTLPKDAVITYDKVYMGNGYRWLSYEGNSGNRLYLPYRPENNPDAEWGEFGKAGTLNAEKKKVEKPSGDTYTVKKGDTLWSISQAYGVTVDQLREWNKLSNDTLSVGQKLALKAEEGAVNKVGEENIHEVKKGDTLWSISQANGISVSQLAEWNNLSTDDVLSIGQELNVAGPVDTHEDELTHTVKKGEYLWLIGQKYDVTVNQLREWNNLETDVLSTGQVLKVTGKVSVPSGFKPLEVKYIATIGSWASRYQTGEPISEWIKGLPLKVREVKEVEQSQSKKAYRLYNGATAIGWVLEQDIVEADDGRRVDEIKAMEEKLTQIEEEEVEVVEEKDAEEIKEVEKKIEEKEEKNEEKEELKEKESNLRLQEGQFILAGRKYQVTKVK